MFKAELDVDGILYEIRELAYEYGGYNAEDYAESLYQALVRVLDRKAYSEQLDELLRGIDQRKDTTCSEVGR